jgi:hypothetical protein
VQQQQEAMEQADMFLPTPLPQPQQRVLPTLNDCNEGAEEPFLFLTMADYTDLNISVPIHFPLDLTGHLDKTK